ncbi:hypothetical protein [uncultured Chitinophaga sp.]|uniref:hypothetical protein n=1 Tax=uncultured Chitinophaga sp. TaxID=339340 RepID=UPI0025E0D498|nr:hypothetical protein [uncultured Chitinophaga sp.]
MKRQFVYAFAAVAFTAVTATICYRPAAKAAVAAPAAVENQYCAYMVVNGTSVQVKFLNAGTTNMVVGVYDMQGNPMNPAGGTLQQVNPATQSVITGSIYYVENGVGKSGSGTLYCYPCTH